MDTVGTIAQSVTNNRNGLLNSSGKRQNASSQNSRQKNAPLPVSSAAAPGCTICRGIGLLAYDVPPGHELFGRVVPCTCTASGKLARARQQFETPRFAAMTFAAFKPLTSAERVAFTAAKSAAERWQEHEAASLIFYAPQVSEARVFAGYKQPLQVTGSGCGKTHLAVALARTALEAGSSVHFETESDLVTRIRASYSADATTSQEAIIATLTAAWLLVLDDIGTAHVREESLGWLQDILFQVVDHSYRTGRSIVLTSNLDLDSLKARLGARITSRLNEMGEFFRLDGPDRRLIK